MTYAFSSLISQFPVMAVLIAGIAILARSQTIPRRTKLYAVIGFSILLFQIFALPITQGLISQFIDKISTQNVAFRLNAISNAYLAQAVLWGIVRATAYICLLVAFLSAKANPQ